MIFPNHAPLMTIALTVITALVFTPSVQASAPEGAPGVNLSITLKGLKTTKGKVLVRLYNSEKGFPDDPEKAIMSLTVPIKETRTAKAQFLGLVPGSYAVAAVHDENESGEMDTNWIGIPREGLGVSRDAKSSFGPPKFKDSVLEVKKSEQIEVNFLYL